MRIVYLDHHILIDRAGWPTIKALSDRGFIRIAISTWNIREIVQGRNERVERMTFVESLRPLYIHDMLILKRLETMSFLMSSLFGEGRRASSMFTETFSDFLRMNFQINVRPDYQLTNYVDTEGDTVGDIVEIRKNEHVEGMRVLLRDPKGVKLVDEQVNHAMMATLIPRRNSKGQPWLPSQIADMLEFCHKHRSELLRACPALLAEDALTSHRLSSSSRKFKASDVADLFHSVSALAYANIFVTNDGYAREQFLLAKQSMQSYGVTAGETVRSIAEL